MVNTWKCVLVFLDCFAFCNDGLECIRMIHCQIGKYFAVEADLTLAQCVDQARIGRAVDAGSCIDTGDPQAAESTLFVAAVAIGVGQSLFNSIFGYCIDLGTCAPVSSGGF